MTRSFAFPIVFAASVFTALLIAIYPLLPVLSAIRPELLCLVVMYWVLHRPHSIGVGVAWMIGLLQDIVEGGVWGGHALALAFVAYLCLSSYQRLRSYSLTQQSLWIFVFIGLHQLFVNWIQGLDDYSTPLQYMIGSSVLTAVFWPILVVVMRKLQRRYRIY